LLLAATRLQLQHPVSGASLRLQAAPAEDFADVLARLGWAEAVNSEKPITMPALLSLA
jgi:tRNA pseudouridine65 synthase